MGAGRNLSTIARQDCRSQLQRLPGKSAPHGSRKTQRSLARTSQGDLLRPMNQKIAREDRGKIKVTVVGAGLAGLSAGCALADAGFNVTLLERRPYIGGRASSYQHPGTGEIV